MIPPVYALLSASPAVSAIVADRIGEHGALFPNETRPYVVWAIVAGAGTIELDAGRAAHDFVTVQVDCFAPGSGEVVRLAEAVRSALESESYFSALAGDGREPETLLYRFGMTFDFIL